MIILDIDGVLFDTEEVVRAAYAEAGAEVPPGQWGKPWATWLIDFCSGDEEMARGIHERKTKLYIENIGKVKPLPPARLLLDEQIAPGNIRLLTAANRTATLKLLSHFGVDRHALEGAALTAEGKADALVEMDDATFGPHIYVDDHAEMLNTIQDLAQHRMNETWTFHHYTGEDYESLVATIESAGAFR